MTSSLTWFITFNYFDTWYVGRCLHFSLALQILGVNFHTGKYIYPQSLEMLGLEEDECEKCHDSALRHENLVN